MPRINDKYDQDEIKDEKELFIIEQFAQLKGYKAVSELYNSRFPDAKRITPQGMMYYKRTRAPLINEARDRFITKSMNIPIANERIRLKRTEDLYNAAANVVAQKDEQILNAVEVSLKCIKEAREEVKGEIGSTQTFLQFNQYNELTDEQLLDKQKELEQKFIELSKKGENSYGEITSK